VDDPGRTWITERGRIDFSDVKIPKAGFGIPIDPF
jgi:hypothetical protein